MRCGIKCKDFNNDILNEKVNSDLFVKLSVRHRIEYLFVLGNVHYHRVPEFVVLLVYQVS